MHSQEVIHRTAEHVKTLFSGEGTGHDWWHVYRVWKMAQGIGQAEGADPLVVELAALLHDIADWKFHNGDLSIGPRKAKEWLDSLAVDSNVCEQVCQIVANISFKGAAVDSSPLSREGQVVQDADRLDAIGAVGIARAFAYGGFVKQSIHDPSVQPAEHRSAEAYFQGGGTTINHFYEKLLLLKDRMNTAAGRAVAARRHRFMEDFLRRFFQEWEGD